MPPTYECTVDSLAGCERVPIGYALQNTRLYVVDEDLRLVRPGEPGELCIGGPGVALGYLHRPELTTEKFVPEPPVDGHPAGTMYRTGDLARELPSGALELLGRRDRQIKLRGFRIELEEIERAAVDTGLADAAFVEKLGQGPSATLIGFVLPAESAPPQPADLCATLLAELARRLPAYMIPARWNVLAEVPVGPTGKADRAALMAHVVNVPHRSRQQVTKIIRNWPAFARSGGTSSGWRRSGTARTSSNWAETPFSPFRRFSALENGSASGSNPVTSFAPHHWPT